MKPIEIAQLFAYDGPNIFGPSPAVLLRVHCDRDHSKRLRAAIKDGALAIGLVIAHLKLEARPAGDGLLISAHFSTVTPAHGAALCEYVVAGIAAEAAGDETWDHDTPLATLKERLRRETLPVAAVQILAEAKRRGLPWFMRRDGRLQIGYGARAWSFDPAPLGARDAAPPWGELGVVPIIAVTGQTARSEAVHHFAAELAALGARVIALDGATFEDTRAVLADPATAALVVGLDTASILRRGLPFDRCDVAVVADCGGARPAEAADDDEWLRALGVPMLISPQPVRLNLADPGLQPLIPYAPNGVVAL